MSIYSVQVQLDHDSALAKDATVNNFHISGDVTGKLSDVATSIWNFYTGAVVGQTNSVAARLSSTLAGTGRIRIYNLADAKPRVPVYDVAKSGLIPGATAMPGEVAICLSWRAAPASGINPRRRRNRIYLGPLAQSVQTSTTAPTVATTVRTDFCAAFEGCADSIQSVTGGLAALVGYSPTDGVPWSIDTCWVDDAFDTQRRRGQAPVARTSRTFT